MMSEENKVKFKKKTKRNIRKTRDDDDEDDLGVDLQKLNDLKELRKFKRNQLGGLSADELMNLNDQHGRVAKSEQTTEVDTLSSNVDLGNTFSAASNRRDEDADMLKFIEEELAKRKGKKETNDSDKKVKSTASLDDIVYSQLPEHLLNTNKNKNEEMLSNQMLNGIPEIDLGYEEKIRNIEATDDAKRKATDLANSKSSKEPSFVPNNMAVNYVQHHKFSTNDNSNTVNLHHQIKKQKLIEPIRVIKEPVVVIGDEPKESIFKVKHEVGERMLKHPGREQASDNYHFEKFKKSFKK